MARKKQEIALQREINAQEEWDDVMSKEGLWIIDIYQEWCGPCKSTVSLFRRIKNESGEDLLQFAVAKADTIDTLDRYRGTCRPCFLFYGSGTLVDVIRGVNPPDLEKKIKLHLANELKVLKGEPGAERVEIRDPAFKHLDEAERLAKQKAEEGEEEEEIEKEVTVVLIKPDAKDKIEEIKQKLEERGIEILEEQERQLTEEEAKDFYRHLEDQEWFEQMIAYMTTGVSTIWVISKGDAGIISEFREILGPANVEEAKESQPDSLRATFGSESFMNAIHAADSGEKAAKELEFFFPEFRIPTYKVHKAKKEKHMEIEKTVALIRPDAFQEFKEEILAKIKEAGFTIALKKEVQLTREQAEDFYSEKKESPFFPELITRMTNGPVLALALAKEDAVTDWRKALGEKDPKEAKASNPQSLRAMYSKEEIAINLLHGSDSSSAAEKELEFFFPIEQTLVVIKPDAYENRHEIVQKAKEAEFQIAARKELVLSAEMAREFYKSHAEKEYFEELVDHMTSGKSLFLVLSRHDAVAGWRELMGDPDPTKALEDDHSIRSIFGKDVKSNAVHGSSSKEHALDSIRLIFGDIQFSHDGRRVPGTGDAPEEEEELLDSTEDEEGGDMRGPHGEIVRTDAQEAPHEEGEQRPDEEPGETLEAEPEAATEGEAQEGGENPDETPSGGEAPEEEQQPQEDGAEKLEEQQAGEETTEAAGEEAGGEQQQEQQQPQEEEPAAAAAEEEKSEEAEPKAEQPQEQSQEQPQEQPQEKPQEQEQQSEEKPAEEPPKDEQQPADAEAAARPESGARQEQAEEKPEEKSQDEAAEKTEAAGDKEAEQQPAPHQESEGQGEGGSGGGDKAEDAKAGEGDNAEAAT